MKKILFTLTLSIALALGSQSAFAQAKKKAAAAVTEAVKPADAAKPAEAAGKAVEAAKAKTDKPMPMYVRADEVDASGMTFTQVNKDGKKAKHSVTATTEIKNGEASASLADIKVGDYVSGLRKKTGETDYEVVKITKFGPKAAKGAGAAKPEAKPDAKPKK